MAGFKEALPLILEAEGGFVDDPDDRGGATNKGITQATYDLWRDSVGQDRRSVREITDVEVEMIYHRDYWVAAKCDVMPWPVSMVNFDGAVNHGVGNAAKILQRALGVDDDGRIGPVTLSALAAIDPDLLVNRILWERLRFYFRISGGSQSKFLRGWLKRVLDLREAA